MASYNLALVIFLVACFPIIYSANPPKNTATDNTGNTNAIGNDNTKPLQKTPQDEDGKVKTNPVKQIKRGKTSPSTDKKPDVDSTKKPVPKKNNKQNNVPVPKVDDAVKVDPKSQPENGKLPKETVSDKPANSEIDTPSDKDQIVTPSKKDKSKPKTEKGKSQKPKEEDNALPVPGKSNSGKKNPSKLDEKDKKPAVVPISKKPKSYISPEVEDKDNSKNKKDKQDGESAAPSEGARKKGSKSKQTNEEPVKVSKGKGKASSASSSSSKQANGNKKSKPTGDEDDDDAKPEAAPPKTSSPKKEKQSQPSTKKRTNASKNSTKKKQVPSDTENSNKKLEPGKPSLPPSVENDEIPFSVSQDSAVYLLHLMNHLSCYILQIIWRILNDCYYTRIMLRNVMSVIANDALQPPRQPIAGSKLQYDANLIMNAFNNIPNRALPMVVNYLDGNEISRLFFKNQLEMLHKRWDS